MKRVLNKVFSMALMGLFLLFFFVAIACATFVENDFGTPAAQKWIYQAWWFEALIGYLSLTLCYNIYRYKLMQWKKIGSLTFHVAFLIIVLGALVTRTVGYEGIMKIREGGSSNIIYTQQTYVQMKVHDFKQQYKYDMPVIMDGHTNNYFKHDFSFPGKEKELSVEFVSLIEHAKDTLVPAGKSDGEPYIEIVTVGDNGRRYNYLKSGQSLVDGELKVAFNDKAQTDAVSIFETDSGIYVKTPYELGYLQMSDQSAGVVVRDSVQAFKTKRLYSALGTQFVFNTYYKSAKTELIESKELPKETKAVTVKVSDGQESKEVVLRGTKLNPSRLEVVKMGGLQYELAYGSKEVELPFYIYLDDFEMKLYPGTENPSSFSSRVKLVDPRKDLEKDHHIYMNNVLDYDGYRFFQSSYDPDEMGTVLSVNHDAPGTLITYIGYFLLGLGFILNLFSKNGRFSLLMRKTTEARVKREKLAKKLSVAILFLFSTTAFTQTNGESARNSPIFENVENNVIDADHADKYGHLVIQNQRGRFEPVHTLATDILKKTSRQTSYNGQSAMQVFLGIHTNAVAWNLEPLIYVSGKEIRKKINSEGSRAAIADFFTLDFTYILEADAERARLKKPAERNQYDKDVLKTDERVNIILGVFSGLYLKIMPLPNDPAENWYSPFDQNHPFEGEDAEFMNSIVPLYNMAVGEGYKTGNWKQANQVIDLIDVYQRRVANPSTIPTKSKIDLEITYNELNMFSRLTNYYLMVGFLLLILLFIQIFAPKFKLKWAIRVAFILFVGMFALHGASLGMRWYLSGHAPWSDGYEVMVFVAFVVVLVGLLFYRQSKIVLPATGIFAWLLLFVAGMNALDPQITDLVPVLKSYWLMIHVAIITGSYGFLGIGAVLGLICLTMNLFLRPKNKKRMLLVSKEVTHVSEMIIMIGLFMLTIGTFLGGVWANESWGRYWGWDAKETWALASVLIYAMVLHFRFIPGLKSQFVFNVSSLWAFGSIIMTFFGVNYYLQGLHSYAQGDPIPIPTWVPITVLLLLILCVASGIVLTLAKKRKV